METASSEREWMGLGGNHGTQGVTCCVAGRNRRHIRAHNLSCLDS
jgi:hypothetical protein